MVSLKEALDLKRPWSWFVGGIFFGIAELIYAFYYAIFGTSYHYITVTTQLAGMYAAMEELFGINIIRRALNPDVHWYIWSLILFTLILSMIEKDNRAWVKYNWQYLTVSFFGGAVFSYGTRLAGGCTLNHMFGGFPTMTMASTFVMFGILIGALLSFYLSIKFFGSYIKPWEYGNSYPEYRAACMKHGLSQELETYDAEQKPWFKRPLYLLAILIVVFMAVYTIYMGLTVGPEEASKSYFKHGLTMKGWGYVIASLFAALFTALGAFKPGTGSVCGEITPEAALLIAKNQDKFAEQKLSGLTMIMFRSYQPFIGVLTAMIITGIGGFIAYFIMGVPITYKEGIYLPNLSHIVGGILLGIGAVLILGCEFRTYVRMGAGFANSFAAFIGFYFGYWPYALAKDQHVAFMENTTFLHHYFWFEYFDSQIVQMLVYLAWTAILIVLLVWAVNAGSKALGIPKSDILFKPSVQIYVEHLDNPTPETKPLIDAVKKAGKKEA